MIKDILASVEDNSSSRHNCPICGGKDTLSVDKYDGEVRYICFKASCGTRGVSDYHVSSDQLKKRLTKIKESNGEYVLDPKFILGIGNEDCIRMLEKYHCLDAYKKQLFRCGYDPSQNRLVIFITDDNGAIVGAVGRILKGRKGMPKTFNYHIDQPFICGDANNDTLVLVEDVFSAISVTRIEGLSGMALLGTNLKTNYIPKIRSYATVIIALDADAKNKALAIKKQLDFYHRHVRVSFLEKDIKDINDLTELVW